MRDRRPAKMTLRERDDQTFRAARADAHYLDWTEAIASGPADWRVMDRGQR